MFLKNWTFVVVGWMLINSFFIVDSSVAAIDTASSYTVSDSQEPLDRRIYSYDIGVDSKGDVHIVYSDPYSDSQANVFYLKREGGIWQPKLLLASNGSRTSISTLLLVGEDDRIHICYIEGGTVKSLQYLVITNGFLGVPRHVSDGGWHTRMQLDENGFPIFVREGATYPALDSKLVVFTTSDGVTWDSSYLNLNPLPLVKYRLGDFIYENGIYHVTYGNSAYIKPVVDRGDQTFHDLFYSTSTDGITWTDYKIDASGTLYEREFWTSMILEYGHPIIAMYKYNEYGGQYNTGTSAILMKFNGTSWGKKTITNIEYPDCREGMGVGLAINGSNDYFGIWDFSPADTHDDDFRGPRGNIALARSGYNNEWSNKVQIDPFSLEGRAVVRIRGGKLYFLGLGDFVNAKLYYREYNLVALNVLLPLSTPSTGGGALESLPAVYHILLHQ